MLKLVFFNTDLERFEILKDCSKQFHNQNIMCECFDEEFAMKIEKNYDFFEKIKKYNEFVENEKQKQQREFNELYEKARLYFIHYYQALYMAIERCEVPQNVSSYYELQFPFNIPNPKTAEQLMSMSEHLFKCDNARVENGGKYFANPNIGSVKVWVEKFTEKYKEKTNRHNVKQAEIENIDYFRQEADSIIYEIFNAINSEIENFSIEEQIEIFKEFGLKTKGYETEEIKNKNIQQKRPLIPEQQIQSKKKKKTDNNQLQFSLFFPE